MYIYILYTSTKLPDTVQHLFVFIICLKAVILTINVSTNMVCFFSTRNLDIKGLPEKAITPFLLFNYS